MPAAARLAPMSSRLAGPGVGVGGEVACGSLQVGTCLSRQGSVSPVSGHS